MKIKSFLMITVILAAQFGYAQSSQAPASEGTAAAPVSDSVQQLSQEDSEKAFGVMFTADVVEQFPAAEYAKVKDLMCTLDKVQLVRYNLAEAAALHCTFKKESGEQVQISGQEALKLKLIMANNNCEVEDTAQYSLIKAKELEINHDRLQQSISGTIKK